jgi:hypothetical protein
VGKRGYLVVVWRSASAISALIAVNSCRYHQELLQEAQGHWWPAPGLPQEEEVRARPSCCGHPYRHQACEDCACARWRNQVQGPSP